MGVDLTKLNESELFELSKKARLKASEERKQRIEKTKKWRQAKSKAVSYTRVVNTVVRDLTKKLNDDKITQEQAIEELNKVYKEY